MAEKRYGMIWRNKFMTADAESIDDMVEMIEADLNLLKEMRDAGVLLDEHSDTADDLALLYTEDPEVAERFDLESDEDADLDDEFDDEDDDLEYDSDDEFDENDD